MLIKKLNEWGGDNKIFSCKNQKVLNNLDIRSKSNEVVFKNFFIKKYEKYEFKKRIYRVFRSFN